jgi:hypothetical protein
MLCAATAVLDNTTFKLLELGWHINTGNHDDDDVQSTLVSHTFQQDRKDVPAIAARWRLAGFMCMQEVLCQYDKQAGQLKVI